MSKTILLTGGAGYIGSHTCVELLNAGFQVTVFDNYCNSKPEALNRVERITGKTVERITGDIRDRAAVEAGAAQQRCLSRYSFCGFEGRWRLIQGSRWSITTTTWAVPCDCWKQ
jgi:UDP-glucose 4-epimerase